MKYRRGMWMVHTELGIGIFNGMKAVKRDPETGKVVFEMAPVFVGGNIPKLDDEGNPVFEATDNPVLESVGPGDFFDGKDLRGDFHSVNKDGNTIAVVAVMLGNLRQAKYAEIPKPRRETSVNKEIMGRLGYV